MSKTIKTISKRIKELRKQKGWTQEQLAFEANLHRAYIGQIERCEKNIGIINLEKIAKALDIKIAELF